MTDTIHGCVPEWRPGLQSLRNYVAEQALRDYLRRRPRPYRAICDDPGIDALTVDDSTWAGARACLIAREEGSAVTLFVNAAQVILGRPYWFSRLDAILDARRVEAVEFGGVDYNLVSSADVRAFRQHLKRLLMVLNEHRTDDLLEDLAQILRASDVGIPDHARILTIGDLQVLLSRGVQIENHGWDHRDINSMAPDDIVDDIRRTTDWLEGALGVKSHHFAVPYGLAWMPSSARAAVPGLVFLADSKLAFDRQQQGHWNRRAITGHINGAQ